MLMISFISGLNYHWINTFLISSKVRPENLLMSQTVTRTNTKILVIIFVAWTLTNMDQAFFGYAIPGILEEFNLPLEAAGIVLTISLMGFLWFYESRTEDIIWYGLTAALLYGSLAVLPVLVAEIFPTEVRASALSVCASASLSLGFAVFSLIVPFVVSSVGWEMGFSLIICPLFAISAITALALPNRKSGDELAVLN
jgi:hypothetical protein|tara:strand:+ start:909 stop:1502 length:594 start_codon:yes stop_codon:yes gene_type:complete